MAQVSAKTFSVPCCERCKKFLPVTGEGFPDYLLVVTEPKSGRKHAVLLCTECMDAYQRGEWKEGWKRHEGT